MLLISSIEKKWGEGGGDKKLLNFFFLLIFWGIIRFLILFSFDATRK